MPETTWSGAVLSWGVPALEHVAQKWEPVLRFSDMRNQKVGVGRVNANERDPL